MKKIAFLTTSLFLLILSGCGNVSTFTAPAGKVALEEFGDYECPACGAFQPTMDKLREKFPDDLVVRFVNFPLPQHADAFHAAEAAECVRIQSEDKFVAFGSRVYADQTKLNDDNYKQIAKDLQLDEAKFAACLTSGETDVTIRKDMKEATNRSVNSTPTIFLDGEKLDSRKYEAIVTKIEEVLAKKKTATPAAQ